MKIDRIEYWSVTMKLAEPYVIAYERVDSTTNIFLRLETNTGHIGYGCAAPDEGVTGETEKSALSTCATIEAYLKGCDPLRQALHLTEISTFAPKQPSVLAMVDMALYDILGQVAGLPLYKILGGYRDFMKTSITIGILPVKPTVEKAKDFMQQGFRAIKIKGGQDVRMDIERILKVREAIGPDMEIRFDANQGFTVEESIRFVETTRSAKLELVEQPTPRGEPDLLSRVTKGTSIPIMADESLMSLRDAFRLAKGDTMDMVNIKLMKVGGIAEALQVNGVARAAGLEAMVGCMDESALGISAGLHFALSRPNVLYADLDGHLDLLEDPTKASVLLRDGYLYPNDLPGLGAVWDS
jgi:L-alanine-DL-glutamate epimerase-like enolase superfamily enzyme